jgi:hypothetical protein
MREPLQQTFFVTGREQRQQGAVRDALRSKGIVGLSTGDNVHPEQGRGFIHCQSSQINTVEGLNA